MKKSQIDSIFFINYNIYFIYFEDIIKIQLLLKKYYII